MPLWLKALLNQPSFTNSRDELVEIIRCTKEFVARPDNDFSWSSWPGAEEAIRELDELLSQISMSKDPPENLTFSVLFAPTGPLQELSMSSGWANDYLSLAERYDRVEKKLWPKS